MHIDQATFVVTDTETTGLNPAGSRMIEIGAVKIRNGEIVDRFCSLVNPGHHVPRQITRLTGITTPMVFAAPPASEILPAYLEFLGDAVLVGHNVSFDRKFIQYEMRRAGIKGSLGPGLCTRRLARRLLHALPSKSLQSLKRHYGVQTARQHRALDDAEATAEVFMRLLAAMRNESGVDTIPEILRYQNQRLYVDRTMPANVRRIRDGILQTVPSVPGVYLFKSSSNVLIYVGKARDLNARVRTYFTGIDSHPYRIRQLVKAVRNVDFIPTPSELSALILESRLIKRHKPTFNRAQVRYRNFPFLKLASGDAARLEWSYEILDDDYEYFGPLGNRREAERLVEIVGSVSWAESGQRESRSAQVRAFLTEGHTHVLDHLRREMRREAQALAFERAAKLRDQVSFLEDVQSHRSTLASPVLDHNAVWIHELAPGALTLYLIRFGRLAAEIVVDRGSWGARSDEVRARMEAVFRSDTQRPERYGKREIDEIRIIASWLFRVRDSLECIPCTAGMEPGLFVAQVMSAVSKVVAQTGSGSDSSSSSGTATRSLQARSE
ncbi:MAG TPA: exonuclease domain-containing protein [Rhodothermia bacterium]